MKKLFQWVNGFTDLDPVFQGRALSTILIITVLWALRRMTLRIALKRTDDIRLHYTWRKVTVYVSFGIAIILLSRIWFVNVQILVTYLGLLSAGLSIALKDMVSDMAAWLFIISRRPLDIGDRIQIGEHAGDVIDIGLFEFTILEIGNWVDADHSTGRVIQVPNGMVFTLPLANYTKGFQYIWNEIPILVTFESNWKKAKQILLFVVKEHSEHLSNAVEQEIKHANKQFMIYYSILTPTVYTSVKDSGVMLTMRYLCRPRRRRDSEQVIWEAILDEFAKCPDIALAYHTERRVGQENHTTGGAESNHE